MRLSHEKLDVWAMAMVSLRLLLVNVVDDIWQLKGPEHATLENPPAHLLGIYIKYPLFILGIYTNYSILFHLSSYLRLLFLLTRSYV